ncbi:MAG: DUF58 domain-containing protein [Betaproteobacteria bacterium]|nr:DUF58 domain-containing protein [Betaproteobacteria bacterium]
MSNDAGRNASIQFSSTSSFPSVASPSLRERIGDWIFPPKGPEIGPVVLGQRRVYILPTGGGLMFGVTLLLMLIGSINYNLSLGYVLVFLLAGNGMVSMLHTWRNLARIALRPGRTSPVFTGELAGFRVQVENPGSLPRTSLAVQLSGQQPEYFDAAAGGSQEVVAKTPAAMRGLLYPGRFRIFTTYPLGLFYAWAIVDLDMHCLIYPKPEPGNISLPPAQAASGEGSAAGAGEEDFAGLRTFRPGDSPRRIAWKAFARSEVFLSKQFSGSAAVDLWLDFDDIPNALGLEAKLSRLARWVIESEAAGLRYGLRLPGSEYDPDSGALHRDRCLQALALFK